MFVKFRNKKMTTQPSKSLTKLLDRLVLILGGTSGIGFAVAEAAVEHGAHVVVSSSDAARVARALDRLRSVTRPLASEKESDITAVVRGKTCDLSDPATLEANLEELLRFATSGGTRLLDHVIFTAGDRMQMVPLSEVTEAQIQKWQTVRFLAPLFLAKLLLPNKYLKASSTSSLTLTSGTLIAKPIPGTSAMVSVGGALEGLARGLAVDLKPVRVNVVAPGATLTEHFEAFLPEARQAMVETLKNASLIGEIGMPEDAAEAYIFCMKDNYLTGALISTDGGRLLT